MSEGGSPHHLDNPAKGGGDTSEEKSCPPVAVSSENDNLQDNSPSNINPLQTSHDSSNPEQTRPHSNTPSCTESDGGDAINDSRCSDSLPQWQDAKSEQTTRTQPLRINHSFSCEIDVRPDVNGPLTSQTPGNAHISSTANNVQFTNAEQTARTQPSHVNQPSSAEKSAQPDYNGPSTSQLSGDAKISPKRNNGKSDVVKSVPLNLQFLGSAILQPHTSMEVTQSATCPLFSRIKIDVYKDLQQLDHYEINFAYNIPETPIESLPMEDSITANDSQHVTNDDDKRLFLLAMRRDNVSKRCKMLHLVSEILVGEREIKRRTSGVMNVVRNSVETPEYHARKMYSLCMNNDTQVEADQFDSPSSVELELVGFMALARYLRAFARLGSKPLQEVARQRELKVFLEMMAFFRYPEKIRSLVSDIIYTYPAQPFVARPFQSQEETMREIINGIRQEKNPKTMNSFLNVRLNKYVPDFLGRGSIDYFPRVVGSKLEETSKKQSPLSENSNPGSSHRSGELGSTVLKVCDPPYLFSDHQPTNQELYTTKTTNRPLKSIEIKPDADKNCVHRLFRCALSLLDDFERRKVKSTHEETSSAGIQHRFLLTDHVEDVIVFGVRTTTYKLRVSSESTEALSQQTGSTSSSTNTPTGLESSKNQPITKAHQDLNISVCDKSGAKQCMQPNTEPTSSDLSPCLDSVPWGQQAEIEQTKGLYFGSSPTQQLRQIRTEEQQKQRMTNPQISIEKGRLAPANEETSSASCQPRIEENYPTKNPENGEVSDTSQSSYAPAGFTNYDQGYDVDFNEVGACQEESTTEKSDTKQKKPPSSKKEKIENKPNQSGIEQQAKAFQSQQQLDKQPQLQSPGQRTQSKRKKRRKRKGTGKQQQQSKQQLQHQHSHQQQHIKQQQPKKQQLQQQHQNHQRQQPPKQTQQQTHLPDQPPPKTSQTPPPVEPEQTYVLRGRENTGLYVTASTITAGLKIKNYLNERSQRIQKPSRIELLKSAKKQMLTMFLSSKFIYFLFGADPQRQRDPDNSAPGIAAAKNCPSNPSNSVMQERRIAEIVEQVVSTFQRSLEKKSHLAQRKVEDTLIATPETRPYGENHEAQADRQPIESPHPTHFYPSGQLKTLPHQSAQAYDSQSRTRQLGTSQMPQDIPTQTSSQDPSGYHTLQSQPQLPSQPQNRQQTHQQSANSPHSSKSAIPSHSSHPSPQEPARSPDSRQSGKQLQTNPTRKEQPFSKEPSQSFQLLLQRLQQRGGSTSPRLQQKGMQPENTPQKSPQSASQQVQAPKELEIQHEMPVSELVHKQTQVLQTQTEEPQQRQLEYPELQSKLHQNDKSQQQPYDLSGPQHHFQLQPDSQSQTQQRTDHQYHPHQQSDRQSHPQQQPHHPSHPQQQPSHESHPHKQPHHQYKPQEQPDNQSHPQQQQSYQSHPQQQQSHQSHPQQQQSHQSHPQQQQSHQSHPQQQPENQSHPQQQPHHPSHPQHHQSHQSHPQQQQSHQSHPKQQPSHQSHPQQQPNHQSHPKQHSDNQSHPQQQPNHQSHPQQQPSHQSHPQQLTDYQSHPHQQSDRQSQTQQQHEELSQEQLDHESQLQKQHEDQSQPQHTEDHQSQPQMLRKQHSQQQPPMPSAQQPRHQPQRQRHQRRRQQRRQQTHQQPHSSQQPEPEAPSYDYTEPLSPIQSPSQMEEEEEDATTEGELGYVLRCSTPTEERFQACFPCEECPYFSPNASGSCQENGEPQIWSPPGTDCLNVRDPGVTNLLNHLNQMMAKHRDLSEQLSSSKDSLLRHKKYMEEDYEKRRERAVNTSTERHALQYTGDGNSTHAWPMKPPQDKNSSPKYTPKPNDAQNQIPPSTQNRPYHDYLDAPGFDQFCSAFKNAINFQEEMASALDQIQEQSQRETQKLLKLTSDIMNVHLDTPKEFIKIVKNHALFPHGNLTFTSGPDCEQYKSHFGCRPSHNEAMLKEGWNQLLDNIDVPPTSDVNASLDDVNMQHDHKHNGSELSNEEDEMDENQEADNDTEVSLVDISEQDLPGPEQVPFVPVPASHDLYHARLAPLPYDACLTEPGDPEYEPCYYGAIWGAEDGPVPEIHSPRRSKKKVLNGFVITFQGVHLITDGFVQNAAGEMVSPRDEHVVLRTDRLVVRDYTLVIYMGMVRFHPHRRVPYILSADDIFPPPPAEDILTLEEQMGIGVTIHLNPDDMSLLRVKRTCAKCGKIQVHIYKSDYEMELQMRN